MARHTGKLKVGHVAARGNVFDLLPADSSPVSTPYSAQHPPPYPPKVTSTFSRSHDKLKCWRLTDIVWHCIRAGARVWVLSEPGSAALHACMNDIVARRGCAARISYKVMQIPIPLSPYPLPFPFPLPVLTGAVGVASVSAVLACIIVGF